LEPSWFGAGVVAAAAELPAAGFVDWGVCEAPVEVGAAIRSWNVGVGFGK